MRAMTTFQKVLPVVNFPDSESRIRKFWSDNRIFEKSLARRRGNPRFVFYEGPPTANGLPHNGHALTRVMKDVFPRYKSMRGFDVPRKAGWDQKCVLSKVTASFKHEKLWKAQNVRPENRQKIVTDEIFDSNYDVHN